MYRYLRSTIRSIEYDMVTNGDREFSESEKLLLELKEVKDAILPFIFIHLDDFEYESIVYSFGKTYPVQNFILRSLAQFPAAETQY